jgi:hypothetical protein
MSALPLKADMERSAPAMARGGALKAFQLIKRTVVQYNPHRGAAWGE